MAEKVTFDVKTSKRAKKIEALSEQEFIDRYIVDGGNMDDWFEDCNKEIERKDEKGKSVYKYLESMVGYGLDNIMSYINLRLKSYLVGCKLNARNVMEDLEAIFAEHPSEARETAVNSKLTEYIQNATIYIVGACNRALSYKLSKNDELGVE